MWGFRPGVMGGGGKNAPPKIGAVSPTEWQQKNPKWNQGVDTKPSKNAKSAKTPRAGSKPTRRAQKD